MYKLEIIIREEKLAEVTEALSSAGYPALTVYPVEGRGHQKGLTEQFRGQVYEIPFLPKVKIEVLIRDQDREKVIAAVSEVARTGEIGDGKVFVYPVADVIRIRTGEAGECAI
ncbi:MAG: P-II family nitrogen regulator [Bacillota bacterium]|nr:P-II family nitrogen regulator [Bacillota bacterium]